MSDPIEEPFVSNTEHIRRVTNILFPHIHKKILDSKPPVEILNAKLKFADTHYVVYPDDYLSLKINDNSAENICDQFRTTIENNIRECIDPNANVKSKLYRYSLFNWSSYRCKLYYYRTVSPD